jgi:hypothetical protein
MYSPIPANGQGIIVLFRTKGWDAEGTWANVKAGNMSALIYMCEEGAGGLSLSEQVLGLRRENLICFFSFVVS